MKAKNPNVSNPFNIIPDFPKICNNNYYLDPLSKNCVEFFPNFNCDYSIYSNNSSCLSCANNFYYLDENSTCVKDCPSQKYYLDNNTNICYNCHSKCLTCSRYGSRHCLSCDKNSEKYFIFQNNTCTSNCLSLEEFYNNFTSKCENGINYLN
jgi:hypothetical protein